MSDPKLENPWLIASRPKTLFAAVSPVIVGTGLALSHGDFKAAPALAALLGAILIQIGTNFANDVADFQRGADTHERIGPLRVTQAGLLSPNQVKSGMWVAFGAAGLLGIYLISVAGWPVILIGLFSIVAGISYTGGPLPLGYRGLGDAMVFLFFGPTAVIGTYYVQALHVNWDAFWASLPMGALATAILVVNNLRDINTDRETGKFTLAVRIGERGTRIEYIGLLVLAYLIPPVLYIRGASAGLVLVYLTLLMAFRLIQAVFQYSGPKLNPLLGRTSQLEFFFAILFTIGINL